MSVGLFVVGGGGLALLVACWVFAAVRVRGRLLPGAAAAEARLAEAVLGCAGALLVAHVLGAVGLFRAWAVLLAAVLVALAATRLPHVPARSDGVALPRDAAGAVGLAAVAVVVVQWVSRTLSGFEHGMSSVETLRYHLSFAARWIQDGTITPVHHTSMEPRIAFNPGDSELLQAMVMLPFGQETLAPLLNLGALALLLLAAWCIGARRGAGLPAVAGVALLAALPTIAQGNPGTADNDVLAVAFFLAAVAFAFAASDEGDARRLVPAGLATGMAVGTKFTMLGPVVLLAVLVSAVALRRRGGAPALAAFWAPLTIAGGFWFLRNIVRAGNPLPAVRVELGPVELPHVVDSAGQRAIDWPLIDRLFDPDWVWTVLRPGLSDAFGRTWPLVLAAVVAGVVLALLARRDRAVQLLAVLGAGTLAGYTLLPSTGGAFFANARYAAPGLALCLVLLPVALAAHGRSNRWLAAAYGVVTLAVVADAERVWHPEPHLVVAAVMATAVAAGLVLAWRRAPAVARMASVAVLLAGGWLLMDWYVEGRYRDAQAPRDQPLATTTPEVTAVYAWARGVQDARIGVAGFIPAYPLVGDDLSNRVDWIGRRGEHGQIDPVASCEELRRLVRSSRMDYVVIAPENFPFTGERTTPPAADWMAAGGAAREVVRSGPVRVFSVDQRGFRPSCPPGTGSRSQESAAGASSGAR